MASGDIVGIIMQEEPPSSNYATRDLRNVHTVWDFDDTTDEEMVWKFFLSGNYDGGGLTVTLIWAATTATSGNAVWQAAIESLTDDADDIDSDSFAAFNGSGAVAAPSAAGELGYDNITFTDGADMDSLAAGEGGRIKIRRDADDTSATDSISGDIELWSPPIIKET